ncbi:2,3,4,5-tetrahydropyridine-2-carboxylate N-succinyltransferase [Candidatus Uzinura diaspidicola str. ASNER]|uniref:2,3,4,5-tetrahydropyridine-2-carboxylate N-succinyltransferase n=1 Tax=Candidatus Uzinura diaspidicola str. ASNER TaxID=1133592 RepID=L7VJQ2_9FLAO|nr:2,3,4,5-tetrahydropyridine-2-carboxylate N-succinyltransferase [Candidatus Uzinura diaspidicola str. ASNER]
MHNFKEFIEPNTESIELKEIVFEVISLLDSGILKVAEQTADGWKINEWVKKYIMMYFSLMKMQTYELDPLEFHDKIPLKSKYKEKEVRVVPHAIIRYGSYISKGVILMPSYVNIGAYIGENTMVDTWATVGSCAQIGNCVHLSGGVGIGGVLEPLQADPCIIENDVFIGSRCIIVEGVRIEKQAVLGAGVVITGTTKIIDVTGSAPIESKRLIPAFSVVIPGTYAKKFSSGTYQVSCVFIIGKRKESTNKKTSLNETLRKFSIAI